MDFFNDHAVAFALVCAGVAVGFGLYFTWWLLKQPAGSERMQEISRAVQEGAAAYLRRQYTTIAAVAVVPFLRSASTTSSAGAPRSASRSARSSRPRRASSA